MAQTVVYNGVSYEIPDVGETGWGESVSNYLLALSSGGLTRSGGLFSLLSDVDFGASYGVASRYVRSRTGPAASAGFVRLNNSDSISWRNNTNTGDLALTVNASGQLLFNGQVLAAMTDIMASNVTVVPSGNLSATDVQDALQELQDDIDAIEVAYPAADNAITAAYQAADATITTNYQAADTALQGQITTDATNLANHVAATSAHGVAGAIVGTSDTQTLTNKTISGASNTFSSIPNSATTATASNDPNTIVQRNGSGDFTAGEVTANSLVTGAIDCAEGEIVANTLQVFDSATIGSIYSAFLTSGGGAALSFTSDLAAGSASTDFVFGTGATRSAGKIFSVSNGASQQMAMDFDGAMTFTSNVAAASGKGGFVVNIPTLQTNAAARPFVVKYVGTDYLYINKDGTFFAAGSIQSQGSVSASNLYGISSSQPVGLQGSVNNSATAVGAVIANQVNLTTAGAKIASFRNVTTEKLAVDKDGNLLFQNNAASIVYSSGTFNFSEDISVSNGLDGYVTADGFVAYGDGGGIAATFFADVQMQGALYMNNRSIDQVSMFTGSSTVPFSFRSALGATATTPDITLDTTVNRTAAQGKFFSFKNFGTERLAIMSTGGLKLGTLGSSIGTPGAATLNNVAGTSKIAAGASTLTITNSLVATTSYVTAVLIESDATATHVLRVVPAAGSFTITVNAAATGTPSINWYVHNVA